jgi:hypothetical protein
VNNTNQSADLAALEQQVNDLRAAFKAVMPTLGGLEEANYPGAELVAHHLGSEENGDGSLAVIADVLAMMREAAGNQAAYDFRFYSTWEGATVDGAVKEMVQNLGTDIEAVNRIKAMRTYAETVA